MDHIYKSYLSKSKGKRPQTAFDLVNFARSIGSTLTYPEAKILRQRNKNIQYIQENIQSYNSTTNSIDTQTKDEETTLSFDELYDLEYEKQLQPDDPEIASEGPLFDQALKTDLANIAQNQVNFFRSMKRWCSELLINDKWTYYKQGNNNY